MVESFLLILNARMMVNIETWKQSFTKVVVEVVAELQGGELHYTARWSFYFVFPSPLK